MSPDDIDEYLEQDCGSNVGVCEFGKQVCNLGVWGECVGEISPSEELCDAIDNNCDFIGQNGKV